jgi:phosphoglycolate phosphatase
MFCAVLFDLDGTLLDTLEDLADAANAALSAQGLPEHPLEAYRYFVGDGMENLVRRSVPDSVAADATTVAKVRERLQEEYARRWSAKTRPYAGVEELLDGLDGRAVPAAILSNKPDDFVEEIVRHYFPRRHFVAAVGARPGVPRKPDPTAALEVAARLSRPAAAFLYLGDTNTDMQTARAAGMYPVGALWGFRTERELREAGARRLIARPQELLELLD